MERKRKIDEVKNYYGETLSSNKDLQTSACCIEGSIPDYQKNILSLIDDDIKNKFYGCGSPIPPSLNGIKALDLGCGTGRDVYLLSNLVGESGHVYGLDMTDNQLETAKKHQASQAKAFGYKTTNTTFKKGYIENLKEADFDDNSLDLIVSNCVINLSPDKDTVFKEIFRTLKPGGELFFSDVFADRRIPEELRNDPVLYGECLSGAMYIEDFRRTLSSCGCADYRVFNERKMDINNPDIEKKIGHINFYSITVRAFKLDLEDRCEDFGQKATYLGTCHESPAAFVLDDHHTFKVNETVPVCGNTADMLSETRYKTHFKIEGKKDIHRGLFDCGPIEKKPSTNCC